jgi:hypothetical protein
LLHLLLWHHWVVAALVVAHGVKLDSAVGKRAAVTPGARSALPVHAHLGLALGLVDTNAAATGVEATRGTWGSANGCAAATTASALTAAVALWGDHVALHLRWLPVGGLAVVIHVVHLSSGRVRHLPAWGQVWLVSSKISSALHISTFLLLFGFWDWWCCVTTELLCLGLSVTRIKVTPLGVTSFNVSKKKKNVELSKNKSYSQIIRVFLIEYTHGYGNWKTCRGGQTFLVARAGWVSELVTCS